MTSKAIDLQDRPIPVASWREWLWPLGISLFYLAFWPLYFRLTSYNLDQHGDMVENHAWGIAWQWGYFKHPPLYSWVVAAWFKIFDRTNYNYEMLAALNISVTIFLVWLYARRIVTPVHALMAAASAFFLPTLTFLTSNYNATSAMLPFWAGALLAYLVMLERRTLLSGLLFGLVAGASLLVKYHSGMLVLALFTHALYERQLRALFKTPLFAAVIAGVLVPVVPHLVWLLDNQFVSLTYAANQENGAFAGSLISVVRLLPAMILYSLPALALFLVFFRKVDRNIPFIDWQHYSTLAQNVAGRAYLFVLAGPVLLTSVAGLALGANISTLWAIPFFAFVPVVLVLIVPVAALGGWRRIIPFAIAAYATVLMSLTPWIYQSQALRARSNSFVPVNELVRLIDQIWQESGGQDLKIVGGENFLANAATFYSRYHPYAFQGMNYALTPWIKPRDLAKHGGVFVCRQNDAVCIKLARAVSGHFSHEKTVEIPSPAGTVPKIYKFLIMVRLPGPMAQ